MPRSREQNREYMRTYRRAKATEGAAPAPVRPSGPSAMSRVLEELDALPSTVGRPSDVAAALAMARLLDEPTAAPQHPAAARVLREVMEGLRTASTARPAGRLAELRAERQQPAPSKKRSSSSGVAP